MKKTIFVMLVVLVLSVFAGCSDETVFQPLRTEVGFKYSEERDSVSVIATVQNYNDKYVREAEVIATVYDKDNNVIGTDEYSLKNIGPEDKTAICFGVDCKKPSEVVKADIQFGDITFSDKGDGYLLKDFSFEVDENYKEGKILCVQGVMENNSEVHVSQPEVVMVLRKDGKIVDGGSCTVRGIYDEGSEAFVLYIEDVADYDEYELYPKIG